MKKLVLAAAAVVLTGAHLSIPASAVSGGSTLPNGSHPFVARIHSEGVGCTGALIDPEWVITAAQCFPGSGSTPTTPTTVNVGNANLGTGTGQVVKVTGLVRRTDRDVVLAKLERPVLDVTPIALSRTAPVQGEPLSVVGFGRTATDWVPDRPRLATFSVTALGATTASLTGENGVDTCKGDAGGPAFRMVGGRPELVAVNSTSWQHGCLLVTETRQGSTEARTDDIVTWIHQQFPSKRIRNYNTLCADLGSNAVGTPVVMATCQPGHWLSQLWRLPGDGTIRNYNGLCMDLGSNAVGTPVVIATCQPGSWASQQWTVRENRTISNYNGLCMDLDSNAVGTRIVMVTCQPGTWPSQQWTVA
ncbi:trypsin-like serine protease [Actinosynnema sp. NPDC059335]|uniref:trypsin-like serine protease n=1 Tax=Actinosynnema sp. NPDC059335 TaxID=3346804 RepID=UPI00366AAAED